MASKLSRFLSIQSSKPRSAAVRLWALLGGFFVFLVVVPLLLGAVGRLVDQALKVTVPRSLESAFGLAVASLGLLLLLWAVGAFWRLGGGTPVPMAAPQRLVVRGPYHYCRNPIQLGASLFYLGLGCAVLSLIAGVVMFILALALGSAYHRFVEEPELLLRFGPAYDDYRRRTPFLFPRPWRKNDVA